MTDSTAREAVYIIIPVHNRKATTLTCLENLKQYGVLNRYRVVIVDDGSTDGTAEAIAATYPDVRVLPGNGDLWWTGAIAQGMQYAAEQGAECLFWLNDDCVPDPDALPQLVALMRRQPDTIVAPTCYSQRKGSWVAEHNAARNRKSFAAKPGEILEAERLSGWCVGIPVSVVHKIGLPDAARFPHYAGDDTYIFRAVRAGFKACVVGDIKVRLIGTVHPKLEFKNHFQPGISAAQSFQSLFLSKKSPYRLSTRFFCFIEEYGLAIGASAFAIKLILWLREWAYLQVIAWTQPNVLTKSETN